MEISGVGLPVAFAAGLVSFLSPCVLPLVPGYVSYIAGQSLDDLAGAGARGARSAAVALAALFVAGFGTVFVLLGAGATAAGGWLRHYRYELDIAAGLLVTLFGLVIMGALRLPVLQRDLRPRLSLPGGRPLGAYLLGTAFAFGWTPCIGPVLASILAVAAATTTVAGGVVLLAAYSAGLGVPFLLAALFTGAFLRRAGKFGALARRLQIAAGAMLVLMGGAMLSGHLQETAFWLLDTFPALQRLG